MIYYAGILINARTRVSFTIPTYKSRKMSAFETEARVIEITKLARNPALVASLRVHLEEVTHGEDLFGSPRGQQFLRHVVEKAIQGDFDSLKERVIGIELFHRSPAYDKAEDAIVRVTASDVRKRLTKHYARHRGESEFRSDIPPGSYIPEITWTPQAVPAPDTGPPARPEASSVGPVPLPSPEARGQAPTKTKLIVLTILFGFSLLALSFWTGYAVRKSQPSQPNLGMLPWSAILNTGHTLQIVASDPDFATEQDITGHATSLADYANEKYIPEQSTLSPETRSFYLKYLGGLKAAYVDLPITADIVSITRLTAKKFRIRTARSMRLRDFETDDDFILLGSPLSNPWVQMFSNELDFRFIFTNESSLQSIENVHPRKNELKVYNPQGPGFGPNPATGIAYAVVAFLQNPRQSGNVLILAGTGAEATEAAARLVTDVSNLPIALKTCNDASNRPLTNFEFLIKVDIMAGSPTNTNIVACHRLPSQ
jgi:hypothetical protein